MRQFANRADEPGASRRTCGLLGLALLLSTLALALPAIASASISTGDGWLQRAAVTSLALKAVSAPDATHGRVTESRSVLAAGRPMTAGSLSASPALAIRGELLVFSGRVSPQVVRPVVLQRSQSGSWRTVAWGSTTATGAFRLRSTATATYTYRVRAAKTTVRGRSLAALVTPTRQVPVVAQTAALGGPPSVSVGESITVTLTAKPARAGRAVVMQEGVWEEHLAVWIWVDVASGVEDATGRASVTLTRKAGGQWKLRGVVRAARGAPECVTAIAAWPPAGAVMKLGTVDWTRTSSYGGGDGAEPDPLSYCTDTAGNLAIVAHDTTAGTLSVETYDPSTLERIGDTRTISLAGWRWLDWGGFYAGPDGCFYVLFGRANPNEDDTRDVVAVRRYDGDWALLGTAFVKGGAYHGVKGIYKPFRASAPHMVLVGDRLVVHMARLIYAREGVHHQVNLTFEVDVDTMTATAFQQLGGIAYSSHSFQQLVAMSGRDLVTIDHGDAYPRAIQLGVIADYPSQRRVSTFDLFEFNGATGDNFTGATVTGLVSGPSGIVVVGNSIRHPDPPNGTLGSADEHRNIYAIWADPAGGAHTLHWLTDFAAQGADDALEPRVVRVAPDRYAVLFSVHNDRGYRMEYRLIDSAGTVLASTSFPGAFFCAASEPILIGGKVCWVGIEPDSWSPPVPAYLFGIDVSDPTRPSLLTSRPSPAKEITAFSFASPPARGDINQTLRTIALTVRYGTDVTALAPTIAITGASVSPRSGRAADFTSPVTYTVTAADGTTRSYAVTVTVRPFSPTLTIGDAYGGGIVAYILQPGDPAFVAGETHGLIAAESDQTASASLSEVEWATGPYWRTTVPGVTGTAIGTGRANTNAIVAQNGAGRTYAAGLARAYTGGGYADWFLPSKDELDQLYLNRDAIGGFHTGSWTWDYPYYWCSSEIGASTAWMHDFHYGDLDWGLKEYAGRVRAVRAF